MKKKGGKKEVDNVRIRIPCGTYAFLEADLVNVTTWEELLKMADEMRNDEIKRRLECGHFFTMKEEGIKRSGERWVREVCHNCGAVRYQDEQGNWELWKYPIVQKNS